MAEIVYTPKPAHKCQMPLITDAAIGTIVHCPKCGAYSELRASLARGGVRQWVRLDFFQVLGYAFIGRIRIPSKEA